MLRGPWQLRSARRSHLTEQRQNNDNNKGIVDNNNEQSPSTLTQTQFGMGEVWSRRWALKNAQKIVCKKFKRGILPTHIHTYTHTPRRALILSEQQHAHKHTHKYKRMEFFRCQRRVSLYRPQICRLPPPNAAPTQRSGAFFRILFCSTLLPARFLYFLFFCFAIEVLPFPIPIDFAFCI